MCGRYTLIAFQQELAEEFELIEAELRAERYNIAPTQVVPVVRQDDDGTRHISPLRWGLIPHWAKDEKIGSRLINARSEEAAGKPSFRVPFRKRRCLVPCSGFYEWKEVEGASSRKPTKQPYYIRRRDERVFALAGLWDSWHDESGQSIESFTILTTQPNDFMRPLHDRMPVIVRRADYVRWLDRDLQNVGQLASLLVPFPSDELTSYAVSTKVNSPRFDDPACIQSIA